MKKIDTTPWRQFCVGELFDIIGGKGITKQEIYEHPGSLPAIQSGEENFGCIGYLDKDYCLAKNYTISKGECLTVARSGSSGYVGYQASQCVVGDSAKILEPKFKANTLRLLFVRSALMVLKAKYAYTDKVTNENYAKAIILLPSKNEEPDWQYMEDYMRQIEVRAKSSISALHDANYSNVSVNTAYWKVFKIGDLFPTINKPKVYHTREVVEDSSGIPYIVRSKFNNGIKCRVKPDGLVCSPKGVITFGAENAAFFYQKEEWCGGRDIYYIDTRNIKHYACMFLVACLNQITEKYTYNFGLFPDLLKQESIKLPATPSGDPDWHYMEMYMRGVEAIVKNKISLLVPHKSEVAIRDAANVTFNNANVTYIDQSKTYNVK